MSFGMLILMFVVLRLVFGGRHRFARVRCYNHHNWQRPVQLAPPQPTPFERIKQRYVDGDLSDEQYEEELDELFRAGGSAGLGRSARTVSSPGSV